MITRWEYDRCIEDFVEEDDGWLVSYKDHIEEVNRLRQRMVAEIEHLTAEVDRLTDELDNAMDLNHDAH